MVDGLVIVIGYFYDEMFEVFECCVVEVVVVGFWFVLVSYLVECLGVLES